MVPGGVDIHRDDQRTGRVVGGRGGAGAGRGQRDCESRRKRDGKTRYDQQGGATAEPAEPSPGQTSMVVWNAAQTRPPRWLIRGLEIFCS